MTGETTYLERHTAVGENLPSKEGLICRSIRVALVLALQKGDRLIKGDAFAKRPNDRPKNMVIFLESRTDGDDFLEEVSVRSDEVIFRVSLCSTSHVVVVIQTNSPGLFEKCLREDAARLVDRYRLVDGPSAVGTSKRTECGDFMRIVMEPVHVGPEVSVNNGVSYVLTNITFFQQCTVRTCTSAVPPCP